MKQNFKDIWCKEEGLPGINSSKVVTELLKMLTPKQKIIVSLLYKGYTYTETARILTLDKTTIRDHLKLIRIKTRECLKQVIK